MVIFPLALGFNFNWFHQVFDQVLFKILILKLKKIQKEI